MCLYPKLIRNPKYRANKKNKGIVPRMTDERVGYVPIGCGLCSECLKQKSNEWRVRLFEEIKHDNEAVFITMTFSNEEYSKLAEEIRNELLAEIGDYELDNAIARRAVKRFLGRWRKKTGKSVKHWLVTELGGNGTENVHLHGILWTQKTMDIEAVWKYGWTYKGTYVNEQTISYVGKYITKADEKHKYYKPIILCSPGIGKNYEKSLNARLNKYKKSETDTMYRLRNGKKVAMPKYYRNKLYTEEEREQLWLDKLDEGVRYVKGNKVKADNEEGYNELVKYYREVDRKLGFGNPEDYDGMKYEADRRALNQAKRLTPTSPLKKRAKPIPKEGEEVKKNENIIIRIKRDWNEEERKEGEVNIWD